MIELIFFLDTRIRDLKKKIYVVVVVISRQKYRDAGHQFGSATEFRNSDLGNKPPWESTWRGGRKYETHIPIVCPNYMHYNSPKYTKCS